MNIKSISESVKCGACEFARKVKRSAENTAVAVSTMNTKEKVLCGVILANAIIHAALIVKSNFENK